MKHTINYIITDLELRSSLDLALLADALTDQGLALYYAGPEPGQDGSWAARFTASSGVDEPDQDIALMLNALESLSEPARSLWASCISRDFNIGYQCGVKPQAFYQQLSPVTLAGMAAIGAGIVLTLYPDLETDAFEAAVAILKKDKHIKRHIGKFTGPDIHLTESSSLKKNQEEVKLTLTGTKGFVFVHCLMELTVEGEWGLKEILKKEERQYLSPPPGTTGQ